MRSLHVVKLRYFRELKQFAVRSVARRVGRAAAILNIVNLLRRRLKLCLKLYKFKSSKHSQTKRCPRLLKVLHEVTRSAQDRSWRRILLAGWTRQKLGAKVQTLTQTISKLVLSRVDSGLRGLKTKTDSRNSQAARLLLRHLHRITCRVKKNLTGQVLERMRTHRSDIVVKLKEGRRSTMMSTILSGVLQNQALLMEVFGQQGALLALNSPLRKRALLHVVAIYARSRWYHSKRSFRAWVGAKGLYGRVNIKRRVEELDDVVNGLKDQVEVRCSSAYQSGPGRGGVADMLGSGEESREMLESNRNLKDELALSYLHFVEAQNNQLLHQREQQMLEIAELERLIQNNKLPN